MRVCIRAFVTFVTTVWALALLSSNNCGSLAPTLVYAYPLSSPSSDEAFVFPVVAPRLSSGFGKRIHPIRRFSSHHSGIDLAAPRGSHVRAVRGGRVIYAGRHFGYGKLVTIEHQPGVVSMYAHLDRISVTLGQQVKPGTLIGSVGSSGHSTGPHLHFEWRLKGRAVNPLEAFPGFLDKPQG